MISNRQIDSAMSQIPPPLSRLGVGCSRIGSFNNAAPLAEIRETLALALDLGVTVFDTADIYGQGDSERELGRVLRGRRDQAFVVTKAGKLFSAKMRLMAPLKPLLRPLLHAAKAGGAVTARREGAMAEDFTPSRLAGALEASLRRLGSDHVDGFLLHSPPASALAAPGLGEALAALKTAGKARHVGVSCDDAAALDAALRLPVLDLLELPVDLIAATAGEAAGRSIAARGVRVLAREAIRLAPGMRPPEAVALAAQLPGVDCVVVGVSRRDRLRELVAATQTAKS